MTTPDHHRPDTAPEREDEALHDLADQQLLELIEETNDRLEHLQSEIARRTQTYAQGNLEAAQHAEISRLVEHLERAKIDWSKVWEFFRETLIETRHRDPWGSSGAPNDQVLDDAVHREEEDKP